ncbi:unnamed protein product [Cochlearia groenlandica]
MLRDESGSVDDESNDCQFSSGDDIERVSEIIALGKVKFKKSRSIKVRCYLSIGEKLDVFVALIDLLSSGSTIGYTRAVVGKSIYSHGSGGKIKRSSSNQYSHPRVSWIHGGDLRGVNELSKSSDSHPIDSSSVMRASTKLVAIKLIMLTLCNLYIVVLIVDSTDGRWEVINNKEAFQALLSVLDNRKTQEARLIESLEKRESFIYKAMLSRQLFQSEATHFTDIVREVSSSPISDIDNNLCMSETVKDQFSSQHAAIVFEIGSKRDKRVLYNLLQEFDEWIWDNFYLNLNAIKRNKRSYVDSLTRCKSCHGLYWRDEKHCNICHASFELDIDLEERYEIHAATCKKNEDCDTFPDHKVLSSPLQSLKAVVYAIESAMPEDAMIGSRQK